MGGGHCGDEIQCLLVCLAGAGDGFLAVGRLPVRSPWSLVRILLFVATQDPRKSRYQNPVILRRKSYPFLRFLRLPWGGHCGDKIQCLLVCLAGAGDGFLAVGRLPVCSPWSLVRIFLFIAAQDPSKSRCQNPVILRRKCCPF